MPKNNRFFVGGFIDIVSLFAVIFLVASLTTGVVVVNNKNTNLNISNKAATACSPGATCKYYDCSQRVNCDTGKIELGFCDTDYPSSDPCHRNTTQQASSSCTSNGYSCSSDSQCCTSYCSPSNNRCADKPTPATEAPTPSSPETQDPTNTEAFCTGPNDKKMSSAYECVLSYKGTFNESDGQGCCTLGTAPNGVATCSLATKPTCAENVTPQCDGTTWTCPAVTPQCTSEDQKRCNGTELQTCSKGIWISQHCANGCENSACKSAPEITTPTTDTSKYCNVAYKEDLGCGTNGCSYSQIAQVWIKTDCSEGIRCIESTACRESGGNSSDTTIVPVCSSGTECDGNTLKTCTNGIWISQNCQYGCGNGSCKTPVCTPNEKRCTSEYLQTCNREGTMWLSISCGNRGCNNDTLECNKAKLPIGSDCSSNDDCESGYCYRFGENYTSLSSTIPSSLSPINSRATCHAASAEEVQQIQDAEIAGSLTGTAIGLTAMGAAVAIPEIASLAIANGGVAAIPNAIAAYGSATLATAPGWVQTAVAAAPALQALGVGGTCAIYGRESIECQYAMMGTALGYINDPVGTEQALQGSAAAINENIVQPASSTISNYVDDISNYVDEIANPVPWTDDFKPTDVPNYSLQQSLDVLNNPLDETRILNAMSQDGVLDLTPLPGERTITIFKGIPNLEIDDVCPTCLTVRSVRSNPRDVIIERLKTKTLQSFIDEYLYSSTSPFGSWTTSLETAYRYSGRNGKIVSITVPETLVYDVNTLSLIRPTYYTDYEILVPGIIPENVQTLIDLSLP